MSVKTMAKVWDMSMEPGEKLVLLAYADHADHNDDNMYPSIATIMEKTGYTERHIQRVTRSLENKGFLVSTGKGLHGTNKWSLGTGDKLSGVTSETKGVTSETKRGDIQTTRTILEPSLEPSNVASLMSIENQIYMGKQDIVMPDQKEAQTMDAANLLAMGTGVNRPIAYGIAYIFMKTRDIVIPQEKIKGNRKPLKSMMNAGVLPPHVEQAVRRLLEKNMTVVDLFSIEKTAIDIANPAPQHKVSTALEVRD